MKKCNAIWVLSLVLMSALFSKASLQEREVVLRFKFPVNQVRTYEIHVSGELVTKVQMVGQKPLPITSVIQSAITQMEQVDIVDTEGWATLVVTTKGWLKAKPISLPADYAETARSERKQNFPQMRWWLKVNPLGKVIEMRAEQLGKFATQDEFPIPSPFEPNLFLPLLQSGAWQGLLLPEKPVRINESWDIATATDIVLFGRTIKAEIKGQARLLGFEKVGNHKCAVIKVTMDLPDLIPIMLSADRTELKVNIRTRGRSESKIWLDINDGLVIRSKTRVQGTIDTAITRIIEGEVHEVCDMSTQSVFQIAQQMTKVEQIGAKKQ